MKCCLSSKWMNGWVPELTDLAVLTGLPANWRAQIAAKRAVPITSGMSGADVFRLVSDRENDQYLKIAAGDNAVRLRDEVKRTQWLHSMGVRVPKIIMRFDDVDIFAVTMTALGDHNADDTGADDWASMVRGIASALAAMHSLPVAACPFDEAIKTRLSRARSLIRGGAIDPAQFHERNQSTTPERLYQRLKATVPAHEDMVVVHGDAALSNLIPGYDGAIGFIDCGNSGRSDRYVDLAIVVEGLVARFGIEARDAFVSAYGTLTWDAGKAKFCSDLYELF
jgi:aminoglycoside 3'-phosphotransferase II